MFKITNNHATKDGVAVIQKPSPNHGASLAAVGIVLHDTASGLNESSPVNWLSDPASKVSAHVVIARNGVVTQLVPFNVVAWHAGQSKWNGRSGCNSFMIGIEIVNPGAMKRVGDGVYSGVQTFREGAGVHIVDCPADRYHGAAAWMAYTDEQVAAVIDLCRALVGAYPSIKEIVTHYLISPGRKVDVNPLFPLEAVRAAVFGGRAMPAPTQEEIAAIVSPTIAPDATTTASALNLRANPSTSAEIIGSLPRGTRVDIQETDQRTGWHRIIVAGSLKTGWVSASFVQLDPA